MPSVIVYSRDDIRGRIILESLALDNIQTLLFKNHFEAEEAIEAYAPHVVILDGKKDSSGEIDFLRKLSLSSPQTTFVFLAGPADDGAVEGLKPYNLKAVPDPLDPELILLLVKDILASKSKLYFLRVSLRFIGKSLVQGTRVILRTVPIVIALMVGLTIGYVFWCLSTLPEIDLLEDYSPYKSSKLYSYDNVMLTEFYEERRTFVPHHQIPKHVKRAFIAVEDANYYKHRGIDLGRTLGALIKDIQERAFVQGGSTITQQLAKMLFLKPAKTITRKIQEIALALQIERVYAKEEILGLYLNQAYFGTRAYGIEEAAQAYFGKSVREVSLAEAALLGALPKAPSRYSPFKNPGICLNRRNYVLKRMFIKGFITEAQFMEAVREPLPKVYYGRKYKCPYFVDYCRTVLEKRYGERLRKAGLRIYTTLDYGIQQLAEKAVAQGIEQLKERGIEGVQAALLAVELKSGRIKAMVGGTNFWKSQFNRATQAKRQPGSAFKPVVYLTALNQGLTPDHWIKDEKTTYYHMGKAWTPQNYGDRYRGEASLRQGLALSLNAATVHLAKRVRIKNIIKTAQNLGINNKIHPFYSSALGASEMTLMELVYAYAALACGNRIDTTCINRIIDRGQSAIVEPSGVKERVIDKKPLIRIRQMLRSVVLWGTGKGALEVGREVYGKTGTTNEYADAWFIGFDDRMVVGVWVGRDNHKSIGDKETGGKAALPIWVAFMKSL